MGQITPFDGAKMALFIGEKLAVILRDDRPGLPFAGYWDLPGGGREGVESAWECAQRECFEELGLQVPIDAMHWQQRFDDGAGSKWFFVARMPESAAGEVVFGDEGQRWTLMTPQSFLSHPKAVPAFQARLADYLGGKRQAYYRKTPAALSGGR